MNHHIFVDVSPLWETEYTGISNVVFEIAKRFLSMPPQDTQIYFTIFNLKVDRRLIIKCLLERSGRRLQQKFKTKSGFTKIDSTATKKPDIITVGLNLHKPSPVKRYDIEAAVIYDLSYILTPECHTLETIKYHTGNLEDQIKSTNIFYSISKSTENDLLWLFEIEKKNSHVALLGNNVETRFANLAYSKIKDADIEPYFLILGTIEPRKNIPIILSWLKENHEILHEYKFVFAGKEGWGKSFKEYIIEFGLEQYLGKQIIHLGYVNDALKSVLLVGSLALIFPSFFEGFGLPVLEAMTLKVPVIASCSTSIPEVLGEHGYYFDPYSTNSLDNAFQNYLDDRDSGLIHEIVHKAKKRASTFCYDKTYQTILNGLRLETCK